MVVWKSRKADSKQQPVAAPWPQLAASDDDAPVAAIDSKTGAAQDQNVPKDRSTGSAISKSSKPVAPEPKAPTRTDAAGGHVTGQSAKTTSSPAAGAAASDAKEQQAPPCAPSIAPPAARRRTSRSVLAHTAQQLPDSSKSAAPSSSTANSSAQPSAASAARNTQSINALKKRQSAAAARQLPHSDSLCFDDDTLLAAAAQHGHAGPANSVVVQQSTDPPADVAVPWLAAIQPRSQSGAAAGGSVAMQPLLGTPQMLPRHELRPVSKANGSLHSEQQQQQPAVASAIAPAEVAAGATAAPQQPPNDSKPAAQQPVERHEIAWSVPTPRSRRVTQRGASSDALVLPAILEAKPALDLTEAPPMPPPAQHTATAAAPAAFAPSMPIELAAASAEQVEQPGSGAAASSAEMELRQPPAAGPSVSNASQLRRSGSEWPVNMPAAAAMDPIAVPPAATPSQAATSAAAALQPFVATPPVPATALPASATMALAKPPLPPQQRLLDPAAATRSSPAAGEAETWQDDDSASDEDQSFVTRQLEEVAARLAAVAPRARTQSLLARRQSADASSGE